MIEAGYERVSFTSTALPIRWWVFLQVDGAQLRNQEARQGVVDRGFRFARGGMAVNANQARAEIGYARDEAEVELAEWQHQPSHALGPVGELIPLDEVRLELPDVRLEVES